jgi:hypothetical protein
VVVKGSARAGAGELATHLLRADTNEKVRVVKLSGVASDNLRDALIELDAMGAGSRAKRTLYHASINTPANEELTPEQQEAARKRLADELGLSEQPYAVVEHVKHGRQHLHVVWSRIDSETGRAIPDSHNYRKHEIVCRELEQKFSHERVIGAHVRDKEAEPRPERGPSWGDQRQAERSGLSPEHAKKAVSRCWQETITATELVGRLEAEGFTLARGDRRDFVLVDGAGELHGLTKRIDGVKAAQVRERMSSVALETLPTVEEAREQISAKQKQRQETVVVLKVPAPPSPVVEVIVPGSEPRKEPPSERPKPSVALVKLIDRLGPIDRIFVICFGAVIDAYQRACDLAREKLFGKKHENLTESNSKSKLEWFERKTDNKPKHKL